MNKKDKKGFTLIELLVVISLIGILSTLLVANLSAGRERGRDAERKSDAKNIQIALRLYYNDRGRFPSNSSSYEIIGCTSYTSPSTCEWGSQWGVDNTIYMPKLPKDPLPGQDYRYEYDVATDIATLSVCLENKSDDKGETADTSWCPTGWMFQTKI